MDRKLLLLVIGFSLFFQQFTSAQTNNTVQFLQRVGVVDSLYSETLNEYRKIYVQFPADYKADNNKKYAVAFILDGEVLLPAVNNVQSFYSGGFTPEMILIGIDNSKNRTRDLTTSRISEKYGRPFNEENGEGEQFLKFFEEELIPYVEGKYPSTNYRTLIGHSYGVYSLFLH